MSSSLTVEHQKKKGLAVGSSRIPGIAFSSDRTTFSLATSKLPAVEHVFYADHFQVAKRVGELRMVFGSLCNFESSKMYRTAVEIAFPLTMAANALYKGNWIEPASSGVTIVEFLENEVSRHPEVYSDKDMHAEENSAAFAIPNNPNCYRKFPSNFSLSSVSSGQGMIEFFELSPDSIAGLVNDNVRPNAQVKSVVGVIMSPLTMLSFMHSIKPVLIPYISKKEEK